MKSNRIIFIVLILLLLPVLLLSETWGDFAGKWVMIPDKSSEISLYRNLTVDFQKRGDQLLILEKWGGRRSFTDTIVIKTNGEEVEVPITNRVFPTNVFMGLSMPVGSFRLVKGQWENGGKTLKIEMKYHVRGSQCMSPVNSVHSFRIGN